IKNPDPKLLAAEKAKTWGGRRFLIRDNTIVGNMTFGSKFGPEASLVQRGLGPHAQEGVRGHEGIVLTGDGHVVAHNFIKGFSDGLSFGGLDRGPDGKTIYATNNSIDIYENDFSNCPDDCIELDWGRCNIRCFRNRCTNSLKGVSCQPVLGGPIYIIRNALLN